MENIILWKRERNFLNVAEKKEHSMAEFGFVMILLKKQKQFSRTMKYLMDGDVVEL